jgi:hypothetical protein
MLIASTSLSKKRNKYQDVPINNGIVTNHMWNGVPVSSGMEGQSTCNIQAALIFCQINAGTHRDYSNNGEHIRVLIFENRLEIFIPGKLQNMVTIESIKTTNTHEILE